MKELIRWFIFNKLNIVVYDDDDIKETVCCLKLAGFYGHDYTIKTIWDPTKGYQASIKVIEVRTRYEMLKTLKLVKMLNTLMLEYQWSEAA